MKKNITILMFILLLLFTSCHAGDIQFTRENPAGFLWGLWHGAICVISLIISIFNKNFTIYAIHNTGFWYNVGFVLGFLCISGGGTRIKKGKTQI